MDRSARVGAGSRFDGATPFWAGDTVTTGPVVVVRAIFAGAFPLRSPPPHRAQRGGGAWPAKTTPLANVRCRNFGILHQALDLRRFYPDRFREKGEAYLRCS